MLSKDQIMYLIQREDIMRTTHGHLRDSLVGSMYHEYLDSLHPDAPITARLAIKPPNIFRAVVDMLVALMMHHFAETIIEKIVDIIVQHQEENE